MPTPQRLAVQLQKLLRAPYDGKPLLFQNMRGRRIIIQHIGVEGLEPQLVSGHLNQMLKRLGSNALTLAVLSHPVANISRVQLQINLPQVCPPDHLTGIHHYEGTHLFLRMFSQ